MFQSKRCWKRGNLFSLTLNLKLKMEMDTNQIIIIMTISIMSFKSILLYAAELETKFHLFMDCLCVCILIANYKCVLLNGYRVSIDVFRFVWGEAEWLVPLFYRLYFYRYFTVFLRVIFHIYTIWLATFQAKYPSAPTVPFQPVLPVTSSCWWHFSALLQGHLIYWPM